GVAGMAFNVRIMPVKVIDSLWDDILGSPFEGTDDVVARGVRYAVDNGAKVLNMSIGRSGPPAPLLQDALIYATAHGAFVSIAAPVIRGTSLSAPHVPRLAALHVQQGITSPAAGEAAMEQFSTDLGPAGRDDQYGYGLINPRASLRRMGLAK